MAKGSKLTNNKWNHLFGVYLMDIDNEKFKLLLKSYGNADQYFFPHEISSWKDAKDGKEYGVGFVIRRSVDD